MYTYIELDAISKEAFVWIGHCNFLRKINEE